jgi:cytochrome c-type biogenesis protein CcmH
VFICGAFFYWQRGAIQDVAIQELTQAKTDDEYQSMAQNRAPNSTYAHSLIDEYTDRLKAKPDSVQYWFLLARTQMEVRNFAQAAKAYQQVLDRDSQSPMIMAELAQAMFLRDGNKMSPEVAGLAKSAVLLDPKNTMALGLLGVDAFTRQDYRGTILFWRRSVVILGEQSQGGQALMAGIEKAMQAYVAAGGQLADLNVDSPYTLKFSVSLADGVKVAGDQVVFIYARAWKGSPMPLAINRLKVSELPKTITLDETMAMSPAASLATVADIEIVARISPEGAAQAKIGDWQASQGPISMSAIPKTLNLVITEQLTAESLSAK